MSVGLVSRLTLNTMLAGDSLVDLVPNRDRQLFEYRRDLAESLAVQYSALVERDQIETVKFAMETLAQRILEPSTNPPHRVQSKTAHQKTQFAM